MKKTVVIKAHSSVKSAIVNLAMFAGIAFSVVGMTLGILVFTFHRSFGLTPFVFSLVGLVTVVVASVLMKREFASHFHYEK